MRTSQFAAPLSEEVVQTPTPLGWGYNTDLVSNTGGSCWDLPGAPNQNSYVALQNLDSVTASHRWSSTKSEAMSELHAELDADADFGLISGDFSAAYDWTKTSTSASELLTIKVFIKSAQADFQMPGSINSNRCTGTSQDPMEMSEFLLACGDRYIASHTYGGYLIFVAGVSDLTEEEREDLSLDLQANYTIGGGNLAGYAHTLAQLEKRGFEFRVVSRGFTQLLGLSPNPKAKVSPFEVLSSLADIRDEWVQDVVQDVYPSETFGIVVDQVMNRYTVNSPLYAQCTGKSAPAPLTQCFEGLMAETQGKQHAYERWRNMIDTALNDMTDYYWGDSTQTANTNKAEYQRVSELLASCQQNIEDMVDACSAEVRQAGSEYKTESVCEACNDGEPPYNCEPHFKYDDLCMDASTPRVKCDYDHLKAEVRALSDVVMPLADLPNNGQMASLTELSQYDPELHLGSTSNTLCTLGGISGELAAPSEKVRLRQYNGDYYFNITSNRTGSTHTLRGKAWCTPHGFFHDGATNIVTVHPEVKAHFPYSPAVLFLDDNDDDVSDKYARSVNGVSGNFVGSGEWAAINSYNELQAKSHQGDLEAWGAAFGLDDPAGGAFDHGLDAAQVSATSSATPAKNWVKKPLIPLSKGICFLHHIAGKFDGKDEAIKIYPEDGMWMLGVSGVCADGIWDYFKDECQSRKHIAASASCYLYDQSQ